MLNKLLLLSFVALILTVVIFYIPNKSNFPKQIMIPIIVSLIIKYLFGDLDKGYKYTIYDVYYWFTILFIPYITVLYLENRIYIS
jgi:hypothetical protein